MKMKHLKILLHHMLWIVFSLSGIRPIPIQIMIKEGRIDPSNNNLILEDKVPNGDIDFAKFLASANFIIDKSLFISHVINTFIGEDILNYTTQGYGITAPSKWGKSTIIRMLKFFFCPNNYYTLNSNQNTSNAYQFFKTGQITIAGKSHKFTPAPLISDAKYNDLFEKYQGQYPVLVINFVDLCESEELSIAQVKWKFHSLMNEALLEYEDVLLQFCQEYKNIYGKDVKRNAVLQFCCKNYNAFLFETKFASNIIRSVVILLHAYFDRRVIIIIDEYERLPVNVFAANERISNNETKAILGFLVDIMLPITKRELEQKLVLLVFGIFPFTFPGASNIQLDYSNFMKEENAYYFGIYNTIAEELMKKLSIDHKHETTLKEKFDNYRNIYILEGSFFNPYSLIASLYNKGNEYPWLCGVRVTALVENAIEKHIRLKLGLYEMLREECINIHYMPDQQISINSFLIDNNKVEMFGKIKNSAIDGLFNYFLHFGFLSVTKTKQFYMEKRNPYLDDQPGLKKNEDIPDEDVCIFIPNLENHHIIESLLHVTLESAQVAETIEIFGLFLNNPTIKATQFGAQFQNLLNKAPELTNLIHGSELLFYHGYLLFKIAVGLFEKYNYKFLVDYRFPNSPNKTTPDIACHNYKRGAIFEIKYNASKSVIKKAFDLQLCGYGENFIKSYPNITQLRLVLLNVDDTHSNNVTVTVKEYPPINSSLDIRNFLNTCEDNRKTTTPSKN